MMDKNNLYLNEEDLENVVGGLNLAELLTCETEIEAALLMGSSGLHPDDPAFQRFLSMWRKEKAGV